MHLVVGFGLNYNVVRRESKEDAQRGHLLTPIIPVLGQNQVQERSKRRLIDGRHPLPTRLDTVRGKMILGYGNDLCENEQLTRLISSFRGGAPKAGFSPAT